MDKLILKSQKIPFWLELGLFNLVILAVILPATWIQFLSHACMFWSMCCGDTLEVFYRSNLLRLEMLAVGLPALILAETLLLGVGLHRESPRKPVLFLEFAVRSIFRCLPFVLLMFAVMALPGFQLLYTLFALFCLWSMFGASGHGAILSPILLIDSPRNFSPRLHLNHMILYAGLFGVLIPVLFFIRANACQDRSKLSSVKANMHTFQTIVETYAVDWGGVYAEDTRQLKAESTITGRAYWKDFVNPYNSTTGEDASYADLAPRLKTPAQKAVSIRYVIETEHDVMGIRIYQTRKVLKTGYPLKEGLVLYERVSPTRYYIYGLDKSGLFIRDKGQAFYLTNS